MISLSPKDARGVCEPVLDDADVDEEESCLALDDEDVDFFVCRAEENIPSGTTRSRRYGIESIVFKLPSVDLVK